MTLTQISTAGVKDDAVTSGKIPANAVGTSEIADQAVTLAKLPHGTSSNNGKFLRANNGADPSFESIPAGITINNQADNRIITATGTTDTLNSESNLTFALSGSDPILTVQGTSAGHAQLNLKTGGTTDHCSINFGDSGDGDIGEIRYTHSSDAMQFDTDNTERMRIDSSGNVGIGTTNPQGKFHVKLAANKHIVFNPSQGEVGNVPCIIPVNDSLALGDLGLRANHLNFAAGTGSQSSVQKMTIDDTGVAIGAGNIDATGLLHIKCGTDKNLVYAGNIGEIGDLAGFQATNDASNGLVGFGVRASEMRFAIDSAEEFRITGNGVTFNGDTAAANALSDYEEGTWTVSMNKAGTTGNADGQVHTRAGYYVKVGKMLWVSFYWYSSNLNFGNGSSTWYISGLPYNLIHGTANSASQFIPGGYQYNNGTVTAYNQGNYRWQSNNVNGANTLTMYGNMMTSNATGGGWEWSGCGVLRTT
tara:strand:+ start:973 stop:2400 length:1428 start_codon:yes stop_codon:yes gene_type:complete